MDTEIRVSTESRPWRRKFSRRSYRDLNPGPFSLESGALTTELSPSPNSPAKCNNTPFHLRKDVFSRRHTVRRMDIVKYDWYNII